MDDRRLAAEVRAVEEGHHARRVEEGEYAITSDTEPGMTWFVMTQNVAGIWYFTCTCPAGQHKLLCKHRELVARRLEREGRAELTSWGWVDPNWTPVEDDAEDPFEGL